MQTMISFALWALAQLTVINAQDVSQALKDLQWMTNNEKVNNLVASLTPEEKVSLVSGTVYAGSQNFASYVNAIPRLGIPATQLSDGEA
jgi:predicted MarR family transcription regulator